MTLIKFLIETILIIIIVFFILNVLKRLLLAQFKNFFSGFNTDKSENTTQKKDTQLKKKINWDAETVDFEEIKK